MLVFLLAFHGSKCMLISLLTLHWSKLMFFLAHIALVKADASLIPLEADARFLASIPLVKIDASFLARILMTKS